jgi:hypothetical protein
LAPLIARVKPAVVSVKAKAVRNDGDRLKGLPPEVQQILRQFGERNGIHVDPRSVVADEGSGFSTPRRCRTRPPRMRG